MQRLELGHLWRGVPKPRRRRFSVGLATTTGRLAPPRVAGRGRPYEGSRPTACRSLGPVWAEDRHMRPVPRQFAHLPLPLHSLCRSFMAPTMPVPLQPLQRPVPRHAGSGRDMSIQPF